MTRTDDHARPPRIVERPPHIEDAEAMRLRDAPPLVLHANDAPGGEEEAAFRAGMMDAIKDGPRYVILPGPGKAEGDGYARGLRHASVLCAAGAAGCMLGCVAASALYDAGGHGAGVAAGGVMASLTMAALLRWFATWG